MKSKIDRSRIIGSSKQIYCQNLKAVGNDDQRYCFLPNKFYNDELLQNLNKQSLRSYYSIQSINKAKFLNPTDQSYNFKLSDTVKANHFSWAMTELFMMHFPCWETNAKIIRNICVLLLMSRFIYWTTIAPLHLI